MSEYLPVLAGILIGAVLGATASTAYWYLRPRPAGLVELEKDGLLYNAILTNVEVRFPIGARVARVLLRGRASKVRGDDETICRGGRWC